MADALTDAFFMTNNPLVHLCALAHIPLNLPPVMCYVLSPDPSSSPPSPPAPHTCPAIDTAAGSHVSLLAQATVSIDFDGCAATPCGEGHISCKDLPPPAPVDGSASRECGPCGPGWESNGSGSCQDIDACITTPCHDKALGCTDLESPAPGTEAGRVCGPCMDGHDGDGNQCTLSVSTEAPPALGPWLGSYRGGKACPGECCCLHEPVTFALGDGGTLHVEAKVVGESCAAGNISAFVTPTVVGGIERLQLQHGAVVRRAAASSRSPCRPVALPAHWQWQHPLCR